MIAASVAFMCWAKTIDMSPEAADIYDRVAAGGVFGKWWQQQAELYIDETGALYETLNATDDFDEWLCAKYAPNGFE